MLVTSLCIATNQHAEFLIRSGNFKSYARSDGTWERVAEAEIHVYCACFYKKKYHLFKIMSSAIHRDISYPNSVCRII
jgi:hypothetical protein